MTKDSFRRRSHGTRATIDPLSIRDIVEAGARGRILTQAETIAVCEALRARGSRTPNQFHTGM